MSRVQLGGGSKSSEKVFYNIVNTGNQKELLLGRAGVGGERSGEVEKGGEYVINIFHAAM